MLLEGDHYVWGGLDIAEINHLRGRGGKGIYSNHRQSRGPLMRGTINRMTVPCLEHAHPYTFCMDPFQKFTLTYVYRWRRPFLLYIFLSQIILYRHKNCWLGYNKPHAWSWTSIQTSPWKSTYRTWRQQSICNWEAVTFSNTPANRIRIEYKSAVTEMFPVLRRESTISDLFYHLSPLVDFLSYGLLKYITDVFGRLVMLWRKNSVLL